MDKISWKTTFTETEAFETNFEPEETFGTTMTQIVEVVTSDHTKLINRDVENQHPISAITNLNAELENRVVAGNVLTNQEIEQLIGG